MKYDKLKQQKNPPWFYRLLRHSAEKWGVATYSTDSRAQNEATIVWTLNLSQTNASLHQWRLTSAPKKRYCFKKSELLQNLIFVNLMQIWVLRVITKSEDTIFQSQKYST